MAYIAIDIGHGTNTKGKGVGNHKEHDFNSKLGMRLKELFEAQGHKILLGQQPNSKEVGLTTRTNLYNREKVDLVVSIHANANNNKEVNGRCAFYWGTSKEAKRLAELVIEEIKAKGYSTHGNGLHAGVKGSWTNLHINRETRMPAVLIEHGFMTGNKDFDLIFGSKQAEYIEDMAQADANAIQRWLGQAPSKPVVKNKPVVKPKPKVELSINELAQQVINGEFGTGVARKKALGSQYSAVQKRVNEILAPKAKPKKKTNAQVAQEVIDGKFGNNPQRKQRLEKAGYNYAAIQSEVNRLVGGSKAKPKKSIDQMAREVIRGDHGTGHSNRRKSLGISNAEYQKVRARVNKLV